MQEGTGAAHLREQANLCRRLADSIHDRETVAALRKMAADFEAKADEIEGSLRGSAPQTRLTPPTPE